MNRTLMVRTSLLVSVAALLATGCVVHERAVYQPAPAVVYQAAPGEVVVTSDPPAPYVEVVPVAPRPGFVWVRGGWVWRGHWVWSRGHWAHPPRPGASWVDGRYEYRGGVRVYIGGGWR